MLDLVRMDAMLRCIRTALPVLVLWPTFCVGSDRFFDDLVAVSPDGEWKVTAVSPDNRKTGYPHDIWQDDFVYSAFNHQGKRLAWTREQEKQKPHEGSPIRIVIANDGWVAIQTGWDQLVFVDPAGGNRGRVVDLKKQLTEADRKAFCVRSSGGLIWSRYSLWHFIPVERQRLFIVRLWWGQRLVIDPATGETLPATDKVAQLAKQNETVRAIDLLAQYWGDPIADSEVSSILLGAHLAGSLMLKDAIQLLHELEGSEYTGITSVRLGGEKANEVVPFSFVCHTARQVSRLSLRRLGEKTSSLPVYEFACADRGDEYFRPKPLACSVESRFPLVKRGMTARDVLALMGSPDFVVGDGWEFDVAGKSAATYVIKWDRGRVSQTRRIAPKWKNGLERDRHIVLF